MSDIQALIQRLRTFSAEGYPIAGESADALESQAKQIGALELECVEWAEQCGKRVQQIEELERQNTLLAGVIVLRTGQIEELAKDARRYRWLRSEDVDVPTDQREILVYMEALPFRDDQSDTLLFGDDLDNAIDAAMQAEEGK